MESIIWSLLNRPRTENRNAGNAIRLAKLLADPKVPHIGENAQLD